MPTDGAPPATAASAYSICTNLPEGLKMTIQMNTKVINKCVKKVHGNKCIELRLFITIYNNDLT